MEFNDWNLAITLIIAIYGAILSTVSIWFTQKQHKREIKVKLKYGVIPNPMLGHKPPLLLFITAFNTGKRTVSLTSMGLLLPRKDNKYYTILRPNSFVTFPHDLIEGKNCDVWIDNTQLAFDLKQEGFSGTINLKGYYRDALGKEYKSKEIIFAIEKALMPNKE